MCGICGFAYDDPTRPVDHRALDRMNEALAHRGPDDAGSWVGPGAGVAMRRLAVQDVAGGRQPMANEDESIILVFNGEIYNVDELRRELEALGVHFRTQCDTEVVLRSYEQFGTEALHRFNGMFAFAILDRTANRIVLARDRLGIKPLFYSHQGGVFTFASELHALKASGCVPTEIHAPALADYFTYLYVPAPDTIYKGVHKMRPGEVLVFEGGAIRGEQYWRLRYERDESWTLASASERFLELLTDSVRLRRISDVPLGAFLSGGVDSSTVVGTLAHLSNGPVKTFTIGFDDAQADELRYARIAADHFKTDHHETMLHPDMVDLVPRLARHFGEPFADSSALPTWLVSQVARDEVTVALSGDGGDELFAGYTWTRMNRNVARYRHVPAFLRRAADSVLAFAPRGPGKTKLRRFSDDAFMEPYRSFKRRHTCFSDEERGHLFRPEWRREMERHYIDRFAEHGESAGAIAADDWMLYQDTAMYLPDDILTKVDRMSMAHGLEARVPLLDHRIVEFAATVPFHLKLRGNTSKRVMKHAVRKLLPPPLLAQRKQGFSIPIQRWFLEDLGQHFQETVLAKNAHSHEYINADYAQRVHRHHSEGRENYGHHLWALLMLEHWLRVSQGA
jgi:asparagine synthase (glutamine-hydrolysing)